VKNLKKILFLTILVFIAVPAVRADIWPLRGYLEALGEYSLVFNTRSVMSVPAEGNRTRPDFFPSLGFNAVFMIGANDGMFAVYVKKAHVAIRNKGDVVLSYTDKTLLRVEEDWGLHYLAVGLRRYFFTNEWSAFSFLPYAAVDGGIYFASNTVSSLNLYTDGSFTGKREMEGQGSFLGAGVEAGTDFWFNNDFGATLKLGYRFAPGKIRSLKTGETGVFTGILADVYDVETDCSGFFCQLGVIINFQRYD